MVSRRTCGDDSELTNHIISILILHHQLQGTGSVAVHKSDLSHDRSSLLIGSILDALFNDVGSKFVLRKRQQLRSHNLDDLGTIIWSSMLDDVLSNIITILISDEHCRALVKFLKDCDLILWFAVLQNSLNDSAAVWVG